MSARDQALRKAFLASFLGLDGSFLITTGMLRDFEAALSAAGWVVVPREPTEAMLQDGLRASQKARHTGISGQTVGAVVRASAFREAAAYRAMIAAALPAAPQEDRHDGR